MTGLTRDKDAGAGDGDADGRLTPEEFQRIFDEANATMPSMSELIAKWITPKGIVDLGPADQAPDDDEGDDPDDPWFGTSEDDDEDEDEGWGCFDGDEDEFADQDHDSVCSCAATSTQRDWKQLPLEGADPAERGDADIDAAFEAVRVAVQSQVEAMLPRQFLIIEVRGDSSVVPFTQAAVNRDWIHCEVVSQAYIAAEEWPIDEAWLRRTEWRAPDEKGGPNWWTTAHDAAAAAKALVDGLRFGRVCSDPHAFRWRVGTFLEVP